MSEHDELVVSIQRTGHETEPWSGHIATGVLVRPGMVLVQSPVQRVLDLVAGEDIEVLITAGTPSTDRPVERIAAKQLSEFHWNGNQVGGLAVMLERDSSYPPRAVKLEAGVLFAAVRSAKGDVWGGAQSLGLISARQSETPSVELFRAIAKVEKDQPRLSTAILQQRPKPKSEVTPLSICEWVPWC
ncbi:hypothetical protein D5S17_02055 [Pseudonocardiaceae bacterium YIM PH 21723]|nr:hypothetical protein D5S17_02055 [Pseudonocardiaceae bacterium YIM PH 21723]